jgi:flagellar biogenesis protein FliO
MCAASAVLAILTLCGAAWGASEMPTTAPALFDKGLTGPTEGAGGLTLRLLATLIVVLVLGALALFVFKKVVPKVHRGAGKRIAVLETTYLAPRKAVHLLQVGSMKLLVASSSDGVAPLADVTGAFPADYAEVARQIASPGDEAPDAPEMPRPER